MSLRIFNPPEFQGNLKMKNYFEGWFFKHVSADLAHVYAFIPGISLNESDPHSFIQVIDGITGISEYVSYPVSAFSWKRGKLHISVGDSVFTERSASILIRGSSMKVSGDIQYKDIIRYPGRLWSPGIMGWYSFVPFMECRHGIVSAGHTLSGSLDINDSKIVFDGGKGYIEKDWGKSFPEAWLWIQANNFHERNTSFCVSVAKIPWIRHYFTGFITFLYYAGRFIMFSTYNGSTIREAKRDNNSVSLVLSNKTYTLRINASAKRSGELKAPVSGSMTRRIRESNDAKVSLALYDRRGTVIYTDTSLRAGVEVIEKIFDYINE